MASGSRNLKGGKHDSVNSWPFEPDENGARFRRLECSYAIRRVIRTRRLAEEVLAKAEADGVISAEEAERLHEELRQVSA